MPELLCFLAAALPTARSLNGAAVLLLGFGKSSIALTAKVSKRFPGILTIGCVGPRKFFVDVVEQICEVAFSPPKKLIAMAVWSLKKLRQYLVEQNIVSSISLEWLRKILHRCRIRWRHSKSWKDSDDPQFWPKYRRIRRLYGKRPKGGRRICVDEFGPLNLQPRHGKHYARIGHVDRHRATYSCKGGVRHMFGAYDMEP